MMLKTNDVAITVMMKPLKQSYLISDSPEIGDSKSQGVKPYLNCSLKLLSASSRLAISLN